MAYEKLRSLIERLADKNMNSDLAVVPEQSYQGGHHIVKVMCFSDSKYYIHSLVKGIQQLFGETPEVKSEVKLTTPAEFFRPTKPQQYFHYMILDESVLLKLCEKFNVSYDEIKEDCRSKIQLNPYINPNKPR